MASCSVLSSSFLTSLLLFIVILLQFPTVHLPFYSLSNLSPLKKSLWSYWWETPFKVIYQLNNVLLGIFMYMCTHTRAHTRMQVITIKKETINLKECREAYIEVFRGKKKEGRNVLIIISNLFLKRRIMSMENIKVLKRYLKKNIQIWWLEWELLLS